MGCSDSNSFPPIETKESYKDIQNRLSTNNEPPSKNENTVIIIIMQLKIK